MILGTFLKRYHQKRDTILGLRPTKDSGSGRSRESRFPGYSSSLSSRSLQASKVSQISAS